MAGKHAIVLLPFGPVYEFYVADAGVRIVEDVV